MSKSRNVYRVTYEGPVHHRRWDGCDSEYSHTTREQHSKIVVAPDLEAANWFFNRNYGVIASVEHWSDIQWEDLGSVCIIVPHFHGEF